MGIINIHPAKREGARVVIGLAGPSGCGKTYTAIEFAYGLANYDPAKVGLLDAENKRGSLYADVLQKSSVKPTNEPFLIGDLYPPFSPARYSQALKEFEDAGVDVVIVDSVTHEWEGTGGCIEMAGPKMNWKYAKAEHKKFINMLLQCDMHVIVCIRAREAHDFTDMSKPVSMGIQPVQEKNFMFEMTASLMMHDQGARQDVIKCPAELQGILGRGTGYITAADGHALRQWVDGAKQLDPRVERLRNSLQTQTAQGLVHLEKCWSQLKPGQQTAVGDAFYEQLRASARAFDEHRILTAEEPDTSETPDSSPAARIAQVGQRVIQATKDGDKPPLRAVKTEAVKTEQAVGGKPEDPFV